MTWSERRTKLIALVAVVVGLSASSEPAWAKGALDEELQTAVATLRNIRPEKLSKEQRAKKALEIQHAWKAIRSAGRGGVEALVTELDKVIAGNEKDEFFQLSAAALLWTVGNLEHAEKIAQAWDATSSFDLNYNYVFFPALEAARTQDPRVLPMLKACLKDNKGKVFITAHVMTVQWPLTHEFIWGAYGPKGLPVLQQVLMDSKNPVALQSAILLLSKAQYLSALPKIRTLAGQGEGEVRRTAIECVGLYGHPQDFDFLVSIAQSKKVADLVSAVIALGHYEDLRAVPHLVRLLNTPHSVVRRLTIQALHNLPVPASIEALKRHSRTARDARERKMCERYLKATLDDMKLTWDTYEAESAAERSALVAGLRARMESKYQLSASDRKLTHGEFLQAANEWRRRRRITGGKYEWVHERHVLAVVTPADIELLLEVEAAVYARLSDECLYEINTLDTLIKRLGRRRYRKVVGVCQKAQPR